MNGYISTTVESLDYIKNYKDMEKNEDIKKDENIKFTSIVMLTYNQLSYTKLCIESIRMFTQPGSYEIIITDNNSTDGTVEWLKEQADIVTIFNENNKGFPVGCNQGIEIAKGESILLLNNDTIVTPNWLDNLNKALYSEENIGGVGAITNNCSNLQQISVAYTSISEMINFASKINKSNKELWDYKSKLVGFCYLIKKYVLDKVGVLDSLFTPGNYEDDDISLRILKSGYNLLICKDTFIHHFGSVSFVNEGSLYGQYLSINRIKLNNKWAFDVNNSNSVKYNLIEMINCDKNKNIKVLEVGCGIGASLLQIKNNFRNAEVYGIESDEKSGEIAKGILDVELGNIESMELNYKENFFDYIILGDVIEHLINPWEMIKKLSEYLKPMGNLIASIPNINHITVVKDIINGRFPYTNAGLLDVTHLRFFTLEEINKLFISTGYEVNAVRNTVIPVSDSDIELINKLCVLSSENMRQQYKVYVYNVKANKRIDVKRYIDKELILFKYMLMRLDNNLDSIEVMDYIFSMYYKNKEYFGYDIKYFIEKNIINKELVVKKIIRESINRNKNEVIACIGGSIYG